MHKQEDILKHTVLAAAPRAAFPSAYAFLSIRNFTECTRQQIFPRRC
jgi:hypothetical protein